ncbi:MAG: flagellar biosynthesis anti-sigma factor FlgM [Sulfurimonas sp.]|nr:MAG: flagellar biosynthesis anti-sigma factor FlgM [Sulfurimonas sp.]
MVSNNINNIAVRNAYQNSDVKPRAQEEVAPISQPKETSKIEALQASIEKGDYKINLDAVANKIADELI